MEPEATARRQGIFSLNKWASTGCIFSSRLGVTLAFNGTAVSSVTGAANVSETVDKKQTERKKTLPSRH